MPTAKNVVLIIFCILLGAFSAIGATKKPSLVRVPIPLFINLAYKGDVTIITKEQKFHSIKTKIKIDAQNFIQIISVYINEATLQILRKQAMQKDHTLTLSDIKKTGLKIKYDEEQLQLNVDIPPQLKKINTIDLYQMIPQSNGSIVYPNDFSAFINTYSNDSFSYKEHGGFATRDPVNVDFNGAINWRSVVLESNGNYQEKRSNPWQRKDIRLIKDYPTKILRVTAGDLNYPVIDHQQFIPMAGVSFVKNFDLQPYKIITPSANQILYLKNPAKVNVYINDKLSQQLELSSGQHDLRNLPIASGINKVRYEITDQFGRSESIQNLFTQENELLAPGIQQFSYGLGLPSQNVDAGYLYDPNHLTGSIFHRIGISNDLTLGSAWQAEKRQILGEGEFLWATAIGSFSTDFAWSKVFANTYGFATKAKYIYRDYRGPFASQRNLIFGFENQQQSFATLGILTPNNPLKNNFSIQYSQQMGLDWSLGTSADLFTYRNFPQYREKSYRLALNISKRWGRNFDSSLIANNAKTPFGENDRGIILLLSLFRPEKNQIATLSEDTKLKSEKIDWRYQSPRKTDTYDIAMTGERSPNESNSSFEVDYRGNRGKIDFLHEVNKDNIQGQNQKTTLRISSGLVFVDGKFALAQPVTDSFALVSKPSHWGGKTVEVNPSQGGSYDAKANALGPGVTTDLVSYRQHSLSLESAELDPGFQLGTEQYTLFPTYKSGFHIAAGTDASVILGGRLLTKDKKPIALQAGRMHFLSNGKELYSEFFTNRAGIFRAEGLKPGKYILRLDTEIWNEITIEIPDTATGLYEIGDLIVLEK